jgi:uncharacterized membrane protein YedE/YeeE
MTLPHGHALSHGILVGAVMLGAGAVLNGACVVGTVARLGRGQWAYAATPLGFFAGCLIVPAVVSLPTPALSVDLSPLLAARAGWRGHWPRCSARVLRENCGSDDVRS